MRRLAGILAISTAGGTNGRLRGGTIVHRDCATYDMRRRRVGAERLGYPPRPA